MPIIAEKQNSKFYFIHQENAAQSEIRIGHLSNKRTEPDYFAKSIANSVLGGQFSSRLNLNLREAKGFTYGIHSTFIYYKNVGYFEISTSVNGKDTAESISEINKELAGIKLEISDNEIDFVKSYFIKRFPATFETNSQIVNSLSNLVKFSLPENYFDNYIQNISNCSKAEIEKSIIEHFRQDELIYLVVGDKEVVIPQLKQITNLEIIELDVEGNIV
jgi:zinc protease